MYHIVIIYDWPDSQLCLTCEHGEFIESNTFDSSNYQCKINSIQNKGTHCVDRKER